MTAPAQPSSQVDRLVASIDPYLFGERVGLAEAIASLEVLAVHRSIVVREAWSDAAAAWLVVRESLPGIAARAAWRTVRGELRRARRLSSTTLVAAAAGAQNLAIARDVLDRMIPRMDPSLYADATTVRDHLVATIEALRTAPSEPPPRADE